MTAYRGANTALTHRRLVYDAFGRLVRVAAVEGMDESDMALYRYNGLNMRLMWHDDADADSTLESSERFYIMHDERWRPVATFRDTDSKPKEAFVWHAAGGAGQGGFGGSSYIDSTILRDRDNYTGGTPNPMTSASDGTLEERRYFCQNWRADVVAMTRSDGTPIEYVRYSPYGEPAVYPVADLNMDGVVNSTDSGLWSDLICIASNSSMYADSDLDWDGLDDWNSGGADGDLFYESYTANTGLSGVGRVSSAGVASRVGYAGYQWDQTISANHVRYRVYLPDIGRWTRRDPLGYVDGSTLYEAVAGRALATIDPAALCASCVVQPMGPVGPERPELSPPLRLGPRTGPVPLYWRSGTCNDLQQSIIQYHVATLTAMFTEAYDELNAIDVNNVATYQYLIAKCKFNDGSTPSEAEAWKAVVSELKWFVARMHRCLSRSRFGDGISVRCLPQPTDKPDREAEVPCPLGLCQRSITFFPLYFTADSPTQRMITLNELTHVCFSAADGNSKGTVGGWFNDSNQVNELAGGTSILGTTASGGVLCRLAGQVCNGQLK